jgi:hypothetical protein
MAIRSTAEAWRYLLPAMIFLNMITFSRNTLFTHMYLELETAQPSFQLQARTTSHVTTPNDRSPETTTKHKRRIASTGYHLTRI